MDLKNEKWKYNRFNTFLVLNLVKKSVHYDYEFFKYDFFLNINILFFFMISFIELPLRTSRHFSMIFLMNAHLEEDIRRKALKKTHRLSECLS